MSKSDEQEYRIPDKVSGAFSELRKSTRLLRQLSTKAKNNVLNALADSILEDEEQILAANEDDLLRLSPDATNAFRDRLTLNSSRLKGIVESLRQVALLPDPVGEVVENRTRADGLHFKRVRAPLGVIFMIFESRPNVILEAFSLAFKSGNAIALRGGSDSRSTAQRFYALMRSTLAQCGISSQVFYGIEDYDRQLVGALLERNDWIDITVPRGGDKLIDFVTRNARMPIIKNDRGMCHVYVHADADLDMAAQVVVNAKMQRPGVCNATETLLVHESIAKKFLPKLWLSTNALSPNILEYRCDDFSYEILRNTAHNSDKIQQATEKDWDTEHLALILNCRVVKDFEQAIEHIELHSSKHSEAIMTADTATAKRFQDEVDAAAVYWNASTRFTDGFEMGLGGELGISTQKLHVRGPVGLRELTTPRWLIEGKGHTR